MFDARFYSDTYDLYRPTITTGASGNQTWAEPESATSEGNACKFFDGALPGFMVDNLGIDQDYDATMLIPATQTLLPAKRGDQPDHVHTDSRKWVVLAVYDAAGQNLYKLVLLREHAG